MKVLLVLAHPRQDSYGAALADQARRALEAAGHDVDFCDLYREGFDPVLTAEEESGHHDAGHARPAVSDHTARLLAADALVLVFPQWWFNVPAILKGWFDRVLAPGIAFEPTSGVGSIRGKLDNIRKLWCITTTGSPGWVVRVIARNPVKRQLKTGIGLICARGHSFRILGHYGVDGSSAGDRDRFLAKVRERFARF